MKKILIVSALATACLAVMAKNDEKSLIQYVDVTVGTGERFDSSNGNTDSIDPRTGKRSYGRTRVRPCRRCWSRTG